jgi:flap endonuclease-1
MTEDAIKTLELMGVPVYKAISEAEAECVNLLKKGIVSAVGSDDMDCLTFGCETLIKGIR